MKQYNIISGEFLKRPFNNHLTSAPYNKNPNCLRRYNLFNSSFSSSSHVRINIYIMFVSLRNRLESS